MTRFLLAASLLAVSAALPVQVHAQTTLSLGPETLRTGVVPFGINLSGQNYYDSGQLSRNLLMRNPGFEGETWQTILHCKTVSGNTCTDVNPYTVWPANFLQNATVETVTGQRGTVVSSTPADGSNTGASITFTGLSQAPAAGDFLLVRLNKPGTPDAGWWTSLSGSAKLATEFHDLSPHTTGRQALRVEATGPGSSAQIKSYFDTLAGHSFVQIHVPYQLHFRAKPVSGKNTLEVSLIRQGQSSTLTTFLNQTVTLKPGWNDYALTTTGVDIGNPVGAVALTLSVDSATVLLDDVSLIPYNTTSSNPTAFRDEVVDTLRDLHPGQLRYMDNGASFGSSLDNLLADQFSRQRSGYSTQQVLDEDIPLGLHDFLVLCEAVGTDPWVTLPPGFSSSDAAHLVEYLTGGTNTPYGARRAALGHPQPWVSASGSPFRTVHLELGNEQWNNRSFSGGTWNDTTVYATRIRKIFGTMRRSAGFLPDHFDLVMGSWSAVPWWTQQELASAHGAADTVSIAPYLFSTFNNASNVEAVYGPMFAQPEQWDSHSSGQVAQQLVAARAASPAAKLAVYEVNLATTQGSASQSAINSTVPSLGGALAVTDHMLLMLRDLGITNQSLFALPEYVNSFAGGKSTPLWGAVVDMGGATNMRRPSYLALQLVNEAMLPNLIASHVSNAPVWKQAASQNDDIAAGTMQMLQSFAFADGAKRSLILLNLSRTAALPVQFTGSNAPTGNVQQTVLTSARITANNEASEQVKTATSTLSCFGNSVSLPPYSMTVLTWTAK